MIDWKSQRDLQRSATALLRAGGFSAGGEVKDREWRRKKRIERKRAKRRANEKRRLLGV
jgi:hypothetical protein